jgi:hypothetical protein
MSKEAKEFDLHFEDRSSYLFATLACRSLDPAIALEILSEIMAHAGGTRHRHIMVECDLGSIEDDADLLQAMLDRAAMRSGTRIAFVNCKDSESDHPAISDDFKLFDHEKDAVEWLLADEPQDVTQNPNL